MTVREEIIQFGTSYRVQLETTTSPAELGKAGAFLLQEASLKIGSVVTDLIAAGWTVPAMVESAFATTPTAEASVTAVPTFSAGGGPVSENIYIIQVDSSAPFTVGEYVRGKGKIDGEGRVHEILAIPDGTHIHVHSSTTAFDIVNGDTVERVTPTGVYTGALALDVDTYFTATDFSGELKIIQTTVDAGADPIFSGVNNLVWTFSLKTDLAGRGFKAG